MTSRDFCYWLQGFYEISQDRSATGVGFSPEQREIIGKHLAMVFKHEIDPSFGKDNPALDKIHNSPPQSGPIFRC